MRATRFLNPAHWVKYVLHRRYFSPSNRTRARLLSQSLEAVPANALIADVIAAPETGTSDLGPWRRGT